MGCGVYWNQVRELDRAMSSMRKFGIPVISDAYRQLSSLRGQLLKRVGLKFPRVASPLLKLIGLSPGTLTLWHDIELGFFSEAREKPGAPPVYKSLSDETAMQILKKEVTPELEAQLLTPDEYYGE